MQVHEAASETSGARKSTMAAPRGLCPLAGPRGVTLIHTPDHSCGLVNAAAAAAMKARDGSLPGMEPHCHLSARGGRKCHVCIMGTPAEKTQHGEAGMTAKACMDLAASGMHCTMAMPARAKDRGGGSLLAACCGPKYLLFLVPATAAPAG